MNYFYSNVEFFFYFFLLKIIDIVAHFPYIPIIGKQKKTTVFKKFNNQPCNLFIIEQQVAILLSQFN